MNNTLTAKEWLEKELIENALMGWDNYQLMEKYANYKNRILEDRIKEFRKYFELHAFYNDCGDSLVDLIQEEYDKHFNIENKQ